MHGTGSDQPPHKMSIGLYKLQKKIVRIVMQLARQRMKFVDIWCRKFANNSDNMLV